jgi:hypothetical protein
MIMSVHLSFGTIISTALLSLDLLGKHHARIMTQVFQFSHSSLERLTCQLSVLTYKGSNVLSEISGS